MTKYLQKLSDIPSKEIYGRSLTSNIRESILKSELEEFEKLKELDFLKYLKNLIIERYKLEKRNNFNMNVDRKFSLIWDSMNELDEFLESQLALYENRILKIKSELLELNNER